MGDLGKMRRKFMRVVGTDDITVIKARLPIDVQQTLEMFVNGTLDWLVRSGSIIIEESKEQLVRNSLFIIFTYGYFDIVGRLPTESPYDNTEIEGEDEIELPAELDDFLNRLLGGPSSESYT